MRLTLLLCMFVFAALVCARTVPLAWSKVFNHDQSAANKYKELRGRRPMAKHTFPGVVLGGKVVVSIGGRKKWVHITKHNMHTAPISTQLHTNERTQTCRELGKTYSSVSNRCSMVRFGESESGGAPHAPGQFRDLSAEGGGGGGTGTSAEGGGEGAPIFYNSPPPQANGGNTSAEGGGEGAPILYNPPPTQNKDPLHMPLLQAHLDHWQLCIANGSDGENFSTVGHSVEMELVAGVPRFTGAGEPITRKDIRTLRDKTSGHNGYLNDTIINGYMKLINKHCMQSRTKCYCFGSFTLTTMQREWWQFKGWESGKARERWESKQIRLTKKAWDWKGHYKNVFEMSRLLIPIHHEDHWTLLQIEPQSGRMLHYDSMAGRIDGDKYQTILRFLNLQAREHGIEPPPWTPEWDILAQSPQQLNAHDCGVFLCANASHAAGSYTHTYPVANPMMQYRQRICNELTGVSATGEWQAPSLWSLSPAFNGE